VSDAGEIVVTFDHATVDLDALQRAVYAMADAASADIRVNGSEFVCTLFPRAPDADEAELRHQLRVEVNDQLLRARIAHQTEPIRNLVFALAFSGTGLIGTGADGAGQDEASQP
jgi:His-Xaa-Ser system protein HxsD